MKKKIKTLITLMSIVVILLIICLIIVYNNPVDRKLRYLYNNKKVASIDIMPTNVDQIIYDGKVEMATIYKAMDLFVNELVQKYYLNTKDLNEEQTNNYFMKNKSTIEKELGIVEEKTFNEFCKNLKQYLKGNEIKLVSYTIVPGTSKRMSSHLNYAILVNYNDNQKIGFRLKVDKKLNKNKSPISYQACTDEDVLEYEYISNDYQTPENIAPTGRVR